MQKETLLILKKKKTNNSNAWLVGFADLIALMLIFFIIIYATKSPNNKILEKINNSFNSYNINIQKNTFNLIKENKDILDSRSSSYDLSTNYIYNLFTQKLIETRLENFVKLEKDQTNNLILIIKEKDIKFDKYDKLDKSQIPKLFKLLEILTSVTSQISLNYFINMNENNFITGYKKLISIAEQLHMINYFPKIGLFIKPATKSNEDNIEIRINQ